MSEAYEAIIRTASATLEPIDAGMEPRLPDLSDIRAVLFDIYGTLLISASGDIGASDSAVQGEAFAAAMQAVGWETTGDPAVGAAKLRETIESHHVRARAEGKVFPEIDIVEVWSETCAHLREAEQVPSFPGDVSYERLAIEFEVRVNPVWSMPGLLSCLENLRRSGVVMGIISNAQFFTPLLFPAIVGWSLDKLGFEPNLRYYSYEHGCAKPGRDLYQMAANRLATMGFEPCQTLYVGNDMRNDIWPAAEIGFRTALFAGDRRSLRIRSNETGRARHSDPDAIVTDLLQIPPMIASGLDDR